MLHGVILPIYVLTLLIQRPVGICEVAQPPAPPGDVVLRAVGQWMRDAFVLFDHTCPAVKAHAATWPTLIVLENPASSSEAISRTLQSLKRRPPAPFFQIVVSGSLSCAKNFAADTSDDGEIIAGNGFGPDGLFICRLTRVKVLTVHRLDDF